MVGPTRPAIRFELVMCTPCAWIQKVKSCRTGFEPSSTTAGLMLDGEVGNISRHHELFRSREPRNEPARSRPRPRSCLVSRSALVRDLQGGAQIPDWRPT